MEWFNGYYFIIRFKLYERQSQNQFSSNLYRIQIISTPYFYQISFSFGSDPYYIPLGQETSSIMNQMSFFNRTIVSIIYLRYILQVSNRSEFSFKMQIFHNRIPSDIHSIERDIRCAAIQCEV